MLHVDQISLLLLHSFEKSEGTKIAPGRMINLAASGQINLTVGQGLCQLTNQLFRLGQISRQNPFQIRIRRQHFTL
jgi:hypothetical protein